MNGEFRQRHLSIGLKLIASIAIVELVIMLGFSGLRVEERFGALVTSFMDTLLLSSCASVMIFLWVVRPMKTMEEYLRVENALVEKAHATALSAEVGAALVQSRDLQSVLQLCAEAMVRHLDAGLARIWTLDGMGEVLELQASAGMYTHLDGLHSRVPVGRLNVGLIAQSRKPRLTNAVIGDPGVDDQEWARDNGMVAFAGHPLVVGEKLLGVMAMFSKKPVTDATLTALASIADEIGLGIERKRAEDQVRYLAYYDMLTGLPNRDFFKESLKRAIEYTRRYERGLGLLLIDLDDFKKINDTLGHEAGDELLKAVTLRLLDAVRGSDLAARPAGGEDRVAEEVIRMGGDEFIVLLQQLDDPQHAARIARRIQAAIAEPFVLRGQEAFITASSGIAIFPGDGEDAETLMKNVDTALYSAKSRGKDSFHYYSKTMNAASLEILGMDNDLHRALERNELVVFFQPKLDLASRRLCGAEALLRWKHPTKGLILPATFVPLAEANGLIVPIGMFVLRQACSESRKWRDQGLPAPRIAVNISGRQFDQETLAEEIAGVLADAGLEGESLEIEITEGMIMKHPESAIKTLTQMKAAGIRITVDDFGTGYSSLNYLRRLPLDALKIDQSFVRNILTSASDAAIVRAIIGMARNLNLMTIAEGVENEEQAAFLREHGCDQVQSYFTGRPMPADEFAGAHLRPGTG